MLKVTARDNAPKHGVVPARFEKAAKKILKVLGWKHAELSVLLTTDREIRKINRRFLRHDYATDVIAFDTQDKARPAAQKKGRSVRSGDIVISLDTAAANAKEYGNTFSYETLFYLCHAALHMMGCDDATAKQRAAMLKKQAVVLKKAGLEKYGITR